MTWVCLLRGINVGGHDVVRMDSLRASFERLGYARMRTFIQSGNVFFESSSDDEAGLSQQIRVGIRQDFGLDVTPILRPGDALVQVVRVNPFVAAGCDTPSLHVAFLASEPPNPTYDAGVIHARGEDRLLLSGREVFLHCPNGYGRSKVTNDFIEKAFRVPATTRNWKTVQALAALGSG